MGDERKAPKVKPEKDKNDGWPVKGAVYEDLDAGKIEDYINKRKKSAGEEINKPNERFLRDIGVLAQVDGKPVPTAGGMLMFGKEPQRFLPSSGVRLAEFKGKDTTSVIVDQREIKGTVPELIDETCQFVIKHVSADIAGYPPAAVREAITNAIVHRDYTIEGSQVRILIFSNRIEIYTPGGLPDGVTTDNMEYTQYSRNTIITETLIHAGQYIEKLGTGIGRMKLTARQNGLKEPRFLNAGTDFVLTLFGPPDKTQQIEKHQRVGRIQETLGPTKSPQEMGQLLGSKKYQASGRRNQHHPDRDIQEGAEWEEKAKELLLKALPAVVSLILLLILIAGIANYAGRENSPLAQYNKASVLHHDKEYLRAIDAYTNFITKFPHDKKADDAQYYIAACLEVFGKDAEALDAYGELLRKYPRSSFVPYARYWRGAIYSKLAQLDNAIAEYGKVLDDYGEHPIALSVMRDMALSFQKQGKLKEAIDMYERSRIFRGAEPDDGYEYYHIALCYLELGQGLKAKKMFQKVVSNEKAKPELIKQAREKMEGLSL